MTELTKKPCCWLVCSRRGDQQSRNGPPRPSALLFLLLLIALQDSDSTRTTLATAVGRAARISTRVSIHPNAYSDLASTNSLAVRVVELHPVAYLRPTE